MKISIIGCGKNGLHHLEILRNLENVEITAIVDPLIQNLRREQTLDANLYNDYKEMFQNEKVDAVCVSTPHKFHYEQTMAALEHNCHVLLEKPMALNEKECREMVRTAEKVDSASRL